MASVVSQISWLVTPAVNAIAADPKLTGIAHLVDWLRFDKVWWTPLAALGSVAICYLAWAPYKFHRENNDAHQSKIDGLRFQLNALTGSPLEITGAPTEHKDEVHKTMVRVANRSTKTIDGIGIELSWANITQAERDAKYPMVLFPVDPVTLNPGEYFDRCVFRFCRSKGGGILLQYCSPTAPSEYYMMERGKAFSLKIKVIARDTPAAERLFEVEVDSWNVELREPNSFPHWCPARDHR